MTLRNFLTVILTITMLVEFGAAQSRPTKIKRLDGSHLKVTEVERAITDLMKAGRVTGMSVAILNDNKIAYVKGFGFRDKEKQLPLTENTVMYGASFTKAVFAYLVMSLVEKGIVDLDKPVYLYLPKPLPEYEKYQDLAGDDRYKMITARMLLSHTCGFPNWRQFNADQKLDIKFTPGNQYSYSGEGINLLQFILEMGLKLDVGKMMREQIFSRYEMTRTDMVWQPAYASDCAIGYDENEAPLGHRQRASVRAAGSMDTTISDYARFIEAVMQGRGLRPASLAEMFKSQIQIHSKQQFPTPSTETTDENRGIQLGYGLGWGVFTTRYGNAYFKEGHDDGWENHSVIFPAQKTAIIFMSNSSNGDSIFKELLEVLLRDDQTPWKWEGYLPYNFAR